MRRVGQTRRRDSNEAQIKRALETIGVDVWQISGAGVPDLLTFMRGRWLPIEVKRARPRRSLTDRKGRSLTPAQCATYARTQFPIVSSVEEALALFGTREDPARAGPRDEGEDVDG